MYRFAHVSDVHLGPLPPVRIVELLSKRILGYINWHRGRRRSYREDVLAALVEDLRAEAYDHIVVSGDLCNISLAAEFVSAAAWLRALGRAEDVTVVPGNHDAYTASAKARAWTYWRPFMTGDDGAAAHADVAFPFLRRRGEVTLIGLSTAAASPPTFATGRLGKSQLRRLDQMLEGLDDEGACRIVILHHPPSRDLTAFRRRLVDDRGLRLVLARHRVDLVLCGHEHKLKVGSVPGRQAPVPVVVAPMASLGEAGAKHEGGYLVHRLERGDRGWTLRYDLRQFDPDAGVFRTVREGLSAATPRPAA